MAYFSIYVVIMDEKEKNADSKQDSEGQNTEDETVSTLVLFCIQGKDRRFVQFTNLVQLVIEKKIIISK